jgi:meso-butanediol dehydrogenase/(S,S)-butanediol dehydrogenase/diacetyl reductase
VSADVVRVAVVTGAGSGIGRAAAELFATNGCNVVVNDLRDDLLAWTDGDERYARVAGDVSSDEVNADLVTCALDSFGRIDSFFANAGRVGTLPWTADGALERLDEILAVNVRGVAAAVRRAAPALAAVEDGWKTIVATASTSGFRADPGNWAYNASKAAVVNMVRAAAIDHARLGVRVNAVAPGPTATGMTQGLRNNPGVLDEMIRRIPLGRFGTPTELAQVAWFLSTPASSFVTGQTIICDGGISAHVPHFPLDLVR